MAGVITTGSLPKLLWPGINKTWGNTYTAWANGAEWKELFEVTASHKNYEEDVGVTMFGLAPAKAEGDAISYDSMKQSFVTRYTNVTYALGFIVSLEEEEDNLYPEVATRRTKALAFSMHQTEENVAANIFNRAFSGSYLFGDGQPMISASHPTEVGTYSNQLAIAADLSEAAIEQAAIDIAGFVDSRGNRISILPKKLIIPRQLMFEATRLLKNENKPETANRDINALYLMNTLPQGTVVNHYFTDPNAWFIITNCPEGLKKMDRVSTSFAEDNDFDTTNHKYRARSRYTFGVTDTRCIYGSNPA
jgi:hypothetical protein